jgi:aminoglycoside N3'-acetyltransferase
MPKPERQQSVLDLLKGLRGIEPLKQLFWSELNYQRVNQPLSRRGWTESASKALADDPVLFAGGGEDNAFHVIYCRLASDALARGFERPVVTQLLREHPYALFVFSNQGQTNWHFLNVKYDEMSASRRTRPRKRTATTTSASSVSSRA